jgi:hypothetical protein
MFCYDQVSAQTSANLFSPVVRAPRQRCGALRVPEQPVGASAECSERRGAAAVEQSSSTISRRSSRWSLSPPAHATTSDESWCQISRREVIKLAIHATLQLPPTVHRLSDRARICRPKEVALRHSAISVGYTRIRVGDSNFQFRQKCCEDASLMSPGEFVETFLSCHRTEHCGTKFLNKLKHLGIGDTILSG